MADMATATPQERLAAFQSHHLIGPLEVEHPLFGRTTVCVTDHIRIHPIRNGWRHDMAEAARLFAAEYGSDHGIAAVLTDISREDAFAEARDQGRLTFDRYDPEGRAPETCWYAGHVPGCPGMMGGDHELEPNWIIAEIDGRTVEVEVV